MYVPVLHDNKLQNVRCVENCKADEYPEHIINFPLSAFVNMPHSFTCVNYPTSASTTVEQIQKTLITEMEAFQNLQIEC